MLALDLAADLAEDAAGTSCGEGPPPAHGEKIARAVQRGVLQSAAVNVTDAGDTVPSVVSFELSPMVTSAVGCASSTTVKVAVPPASVVFPEIADTVTPEASLSVLVTLTSAAFTPLYPGSVLTAAAVMMV
mgnify:CR=1 FL=1